MASVARTVCVRKPPFGCYRCVQESYEQEVLSDFNSCICVVSV